MADQQGDAHLQVLIDAIRAEIRLNELEKILVTLTRLEPTDDELEAIVGAIKRNRVN